MGEKIYPEKVKKWVDLLRNEADRLRAAAELGRMGIRTRGPGVMTRGTLREPAQPRVEGVDFTPAINALKDQSPEVRREVAFALGEWADETAIDVLALLATGDNYDPDPSVRSAVVDALGKIGGQKAVSTLQQVAMDDPEEDVRIRAIGALGSLAAKEQPELVATRGPIVRTRGGVRTRGATITISPEAQEVLDLLREIRESDSSSYVRDIADETLADLGE